MEQDDWEGKESSRCPQRHDQTKHERFIGQVKSRRLLNDAGRPTTVQGAAAMSAFQLESADLAHTAGSR